MGVHGMVVVVDGLVGAVRGVRQGCLMAALLERKEFEGEEEGGMGLDGEGDGGKKEGEAEGEGEGDGEEEGEGSESDWGAESEDDEGSDQGSESEDAQYQSVSNDGEKLSKIRILEIRAEVMAKEFAEEICGPEFVMPDDFY